MISAATVQSTALESGVTYYIDAKNGDDSNSGLSENSAWKTLEAASAKIYSEGDKILLNAGGIFNGTFSAKGNGTPDNHIIFGAYGDTETLGKPIVRSSSEEAVLVTINNVSGWTVENIEFTAPNGSGIFVTAAGETETTDITVRNCSFHDIWYKVCANSNTGHCPIMLRSSGRTARLRNITIQDCNIYDCAFGIKMSGLSREFTPDMFVSPEESYNTNYLIEGVSLNNILYDGIIIMSVCGMIIRNCSIINASLRDDYYTAPIWSHHAKNYVVENCEIAGSTNEKDGMAVDFDGWTTDSTFQYIYSHDNVRFIHSCCYDNYTKNANNTVRYCLSVNDNKQENSIVSLLNASAADYAEDEAAVCMDNFRFYNNTLINCSDITCMYLTNSVIANNIFIGATPKTTIKYMRTNAGTNRIPNSKYSGIFSNNCFLNVSVPAIARKNYICDPCFSGDDITDKNTFRLTSESRLIGVGIQTEDDMGECDFYGNPLSETHNIGCYDGEGVQKTADIGSVYNTGLIFGTILASVIGFFENIFNIYWMF